MKKLFQWVAWCSGVRLSRGSLDLIKATASRLAGWPASVSAAEMRWSSGIMILSFGFDDV